MKKLNLLLLNWGLSEPNIAHVLSKQLDITKILLIDILTDEMRSNSTIGIQMRKKVEEGKLISQELIEKFLITNLTQSDDDVLLFQYPRTEEQFLGLVKLLDSHNIELETIWYFKHRKPEEFLQQHFDDIKYQGWFSKYGGKALQKWKTNHTKMSAFINQVLDHSAHIPTKVIELDYVSRSEMKDYLTEKIKNAL